MAITLAPAALERIQGYLAETPGAVGLRFGVKRTGCSG
ncbi:MAG TPA: iron-sulfur cluster assembly accessory protein, partial [Xanthomonadaceae bacterium]|nr:iron-sulfur cluster assembly accessory protein [Xanthomonadaceae bacterium]